MDVALAVCAGLLAVGSWWTFGPEHQPPPEPVDWRVDPRCDFAREPRKGFQVVR